MKDQAYCVDNYCKERKILKMVNFWRDYTQEKKEYRMNALIFKHRGYQRKLIYFWKVVRLILGYIIGYCTESY